MATQTIQVESLSGDTLTMEVFSLTSDTAQATASATEATNRHGLYSAAFTDLPTGDHRCMMVDASSNVSSVQYATTTAATETVQAYDSLSSGGGATAAEIWQESANSHTTGNTMGHWLNIVKKSVFNVEGEIVAGGTLSAVTFRTDLTQADGAFDDQLILFTSGSLIGEARPISSSSLSNGVIVVQEEFTSAPSASDEFVILPQHIHSLAAIGNEVKSLGSTIEVVSPLKANNGETDIELVYGQQYDDSGNAATLFGSVSFAIPTATQDLTTATGGEFKVYGSSATPTASLTSVTYENVGTANQRVKVALSAVNAQLTTNEFYTYTLTATYASGSPAQISRGKLTLVSVVPTE
jgi:hypothetical protein